MHSWVFVSAISQVLIIIKYGETLWKRSVNNEKHVRMYLNKGMLPYNDALIFKTRKTDE